MFGRLNRAPLDFDGPHKLHDFFERRAGRENLLHAHAFKRSHVLLRNDAAAENRDASCLVLFEQLDHFAEQSYMRRRVDR